MFPTFLTRCSLLRLTLRSPTHNVGQAYAHATRLYTVESTDLQGMLARRASPEAAKKSRYPGTFGLAAPRRRDKPPGQIFQEIRV